jgi:hypothetical protein
MNKFTKHKDGHRQKCCDKPLTTLEDYYGGGSHYWHLKCDHCNNEYVYDTYEFKLRKYNYD